MRIISGQARGIRLEAPPGLDVRPTTDRVKESLFAILGDLRGKTVVDLFAGSGALGLEALSRGAAAVVFVESEPRHLRTLATNLAKVRKSIDSGAGHEGDENAVRVVRGDVRHLPRLLPELSGQVDIILADPPYQPGLRQFGAIELLGDETIAAWAGKALLVIEYATRVAMPWAPLSSWKLQRCELYGHTAIAFATVQG